MIESRPSRRAAMVGGAALATLSACGTTDRDPADRALITRARDLSQQMRDGLGTTPLMTRLSLVHDQQIAQFDRVVAQVAPAGTPSTPAGRVAAKNLRTRELHLAETFRALALKAKRGDVAALLASAAAGIEQALVQR